MNNAEEMIKNIGNKLYESFKDEKDGVKYSKDLAWKVGNEYIIGNLCAKNINVLRIKAKKWAGGSNFRLYITGKFYYYKSDKQIGYIDVYNKTFTENKQEKEKILDALKDIDYIKIDVIWNKIVSVILKALNEEVK